MHPILQCYISYCSNKNQGDQDWDSLRYLTPKVHRAVKKGLLEDNQTARTLKDIRHEIVHEYVVEDLKNLQLEILRYTTILLELVKVALSYIDDKQLMRQAD